MKHPAYMGVKPSGHVWAGDIPSHWSVLPLKRVARIRYGLGQPPQESEEGLPLLRATNISHGRITTDGLLYVDPSDVPPGREAELRAEEILVVRSGAYTGDSAIVSKEYTGAIAGYDMVVTVRRGCPSFMAWEMLSPEVNVLQFGLFKSRAAQPHLNAEELGETVFIVPPYDEQKEIASFLDRKTALIDDLIAKRERQIELLQEQRTALISRAVSKGPNPDVPMKDSGVEWLGKVPEHWSVAPVYSRYEVQLGKMLDEKQITGKHLAPYLRNVDVQWDRVNVIDLPLMDFDQGDRQKFALKSGDLLVCEGGEVGRAAIWGGNLEECYYQKALHRVRPRSDRDDPRFFFYLLYAASKNDAFVVGGNQTTIGHLTADKLRKHRLPFPSREEQGEISVFLDRETTKIDTFVAKVRQSIEKLREYRQSLISSAVTGKIDVRGNVASATSLEVPA